MGESAAVEALRLRIALQMLAIVQIVLMQQNRQDCKLQCKLVNLLQQRECSQGLKCDLNDHKLVVTFVFYFIGLFLIETLSVINKLSSKK